VVSKLGGFVFKDDVDADTTHVVCGGNRRTLNVLHGIAKGCWLVTLSWVMESLEANSWIAEEAYECVDFFPACRVRLSLTISLAFIAFFIICFCLWQLSHEQVERKLFLNCGAIYVAAETVPPRKHVVALLEEAGAHMVADSKSAKICVGKENGVKKTVAEKWVLGKDTRSLNFVQSVLFLIFSNSDSITSHHCLPFEPYKN
jgi:microcephalin